MAARIMLPAFGGTPAVWTASMVFFQGVLLLGYLYAHLGNRYLGPKRHAILHLVLFALAGLTLPFATRPAMGAQGQSIPALTLIGQLGLLVGPVFLVISAGAPTLQRWFASTSDPAAKDPYFLYSASNVGSMAALLAYPFYVEAQFDLREQTWVWAAGYAMLAAVLIPCAVVVWRSQPVVDVTLSDSESNRDQEVITGKQRLMWVALSAVPSSLLLGVTNYITANIAPMPLLWVIPLALYLLTFIVAFSGQKRISALLLGRIMPLIVTPLAVIIVMNAIEPIQLMVVLHLVGFFVAAWMCHARLSESRPGPKHLTEFYLWMSVGGVVGGIFNGLVAPVLFRDYWEYPLALVLAATLRPVAAQYRKASKLDVGYALLVGLASVATYFGASRFGIEGALWTGVVIGVPAVLMFLAVDRPSRFGLSMGAIFFATTTLNVTAKGRIVEVERSFFGVHKVEVTENGRFHRLVHGTTLHGLQDTRDPKTPLTYYYPTGPVGQVMHRLPADRQVEVGLVGLGVGSIAAYGKPGQHFTYFEIDPYVKSIAEDGLLFTFLRDTEAKLDVVLGDARLTLSERPDESFDLIMLDAFSSDSIPIHLLTKEAVAMYFRKLKPNGILTVHVSNRYLTLAPVLQRNAEELGLVAYENQDGATPEEAAAGKQSSDWILLARSTEIAQPILGRGVDWLAIDPKPGFRTWTDNYSNILSVYDSEK